AFRDRYKAQGYGELRRPAFYKVERSADDLLPHADDQDLGGPGRRVRHFWPESEIIDEDLIHVLVRATVRLDFIQGLGNSNASNAAKPADFYEQQQSTRKHILIGRPVDHTGPPITLYHPVFGRFLRNLQSVEPLSAVAYSNVADYFHISQALYSEEDGRDDKSRTPLATVLGGVLSKVWVRGAQPDGANPTDDSAWCIIMEMKNEIGSGACDPSIQAAQSYTQCWKTKPASDLLSRCCCPSILIAIAGPWMSVLGAIFLKRPVIQPLTDFLWIGDNPNKPLDIEHIARVFHAIAEARTELRSFYANLPGPDQGAASTLPYPTDFVDPNGKKVKFKYKGHVNRTGTPSGKKVLVFFAQTLDDPPKRVVVKFVSRYNSAAHRLLANESLAPKLLYDGTTYPEDQPGPESNMIVMERIRGVELGRYDEDLPDCVSTDLKRALELLHSQGLVFGDLRPPNVMLVQDATGE
ncbi:hypothetical protein FRC11_002276, partial [Ceratobasidium sp. 423]